MSYKPVARQTKEKRKHQLSSPGTKLGYLREYCFIDSNGIQKDNEHLIASKLNELHKNFHTSSPN
jgi:hypothetical protein